MNSENTLKFTFCTSANQKYMTEIHNFSAPSEMAKIINLEQPELVPDGIPKERMPALHLFRPVPSSYVKKEHIEQGMDEYGKKKLTWHVDGDPRREVPLHITAQKKILMGRRIEAVHAISILKLDIDEQYSHDVYERIKAKLMQDGKSFVMYTTLSNDTVKNCNVFDGSGKKIKEFSGKLSKTGKPLLNKEKTEKRRAFSFRVFLFLDRHIIRTGRIDDFNVEMKVIYKYIADYLQLSGQFPQEKLDASCTNHHQFMIPPVFKMGDETAQERYHCAYNQSP